MALPRQFLLSVHRIDPAQRELGQWEAPIFGASRFKNERQFRHESDARFFCSAFSDEGLDGQGFDSELVTFSSVR